MTVVYLVMFILSIISLVYIGLYNYKNIEPFFSGISIAVPVSILGYFLENLAAGRDGVNIAFSVAFVDQTFLASMMFVCILKEMGIKLNNNLKLFIHGANFAIYLIAVMPNTRHLYYSRMIVSDTIIGRKIITEAGPVFVVHKILLVILVAILIWKRIELEVKGKKIRGHMVLPYFIVIELGIGATMLQELFGVEYSLAPILYGVGITYLSICYKRNYRHDIESIVTNIFGGNEKSGYVAFDNNHRLLAANDLALKIFPGLSEINVDEVIPKEEIELSRIFDKNLTAMEEGKKIDFHEQINGADYRIDTRFFALEKGEATAGVVFRIDDYTIQQSHEVLLQNYDEELHSEVEKKTKIYKKIQQNVGITMADLIESRNNIRTGHIKRITDVVKILCDTMAENKICNLTYDDADIIIRAAVFYDLGKMTIEDTILFKSGELTEEEYEKIKQHPERGSIIIRNMFENLDEDEEFIEMACDAAMYHHERFDGTGYPKGLKGEEIPLVARILALADVYDALVSERCYKEKMSFEEAYHEMLDCMGTQFDPDMKKVFQLCRPKVENYYKMNCT